MILGAYSRADGGGGRPLPRVVQVSIAPLEHPRFRVAIHEEGTGLAYRQEVTGPAGHGGLAARTGGPCSTSTSRCSASRGKRCVRPRASWPSTSRSGASSRPPRRRALFRDVNAGVAVLDARRAVRGRYEESADLAAFGAVFFGDAGSEDGRRDLAQAV